MTGLILVPLDGSSVAERAQPYAVALARERRLRLLLVRVLEPTPSRGMSLVQDRTPAATLNASPCGCARKRSRSKRTSPRHCSGPFPKCSLARPNSADAS